MRAQAASVRTWLMFQALELELELDHHAQHEVAWTNIRRSPPMCHCQPSCSSRGARRSAAHHKAGWGVRLAQISFAVADKEKRETKRWPPGPAHETTIRSGLAWPLGAGTEEE